MFAFEEDIRRGELELYKVYLSLTVYATWNLCLLFLNRDQQKEQDKPTTWQQSMKKNRNPQETMNLYNIW